MEKHLESLAKALKTLRIADHMAYVTYPVVNDKRLLLKILDNLYTTILSTINAILQHDYLWKKIQLYQDPKSNFQVFKEKCAPRYNITRQDISEILEILSTVEKHKKSPLEFARRDKIVIMSQNLKTKVITLEIIKNHIQSTKNLLKKASYGIKHTC